jgi:hypothetical protein
MINLFKRDAPSNTAVNKKKEKQEAKNLSNSHSDKSERFSSTPRL